jgi:hypothetical protein
VRERVAARGGLRLHHTILLDEAQDYLPEEIELFGEIADYLFVVLGSATLTSYA